MKYATLVDDKPLPIAYWAMFALMQSIKSEMIFVHTGLKSISVKGSLQKQKKEKSFAKPLITQ